MPWNRIRFSSHQLGTRLLPGATQTSAAGWEPTSQTRFAWFLAHSFHLTLLWSGYAAEWGGGASQLCSTAQRKGELHGLRVGCRSRWTGHVFCRKASLAKLCTRDWPFSPPTQRFSSRRSWPTRASVFLPTRKRSF